MANLSVYIKKGWIVWMYTTSVKIALSIPPFVKGDKP